MRSFRPNTFLLSLESNNFLSINLPCLVKGLCYFDEITISYHQLSKLPIVLYTNDNVVYAVRCLYYATRNTLEMKQEPHPELSHDLGYSWNEILAQKLDDFPHVYIKNKKRWKGLNYLVWSANASSECCYGTSTWLYRKDDDIIFLVTPDYAWHFDDQSSDDDFFISYESFIKNYKPLAQIILGKTTIENLFQWSSDMLALMEENDKKLRLQYEQNNPY